MVKNGMALRQDRPGSGPDHASADKAIFREEFAIFERTTYLDNAARTPMATSVGEEVARYVAVARAEGARKSEWLDRVERVRERVAKFIGAERSEVAFTKNTSEGINLVAQSLKLPEGSNVIICPELEHAANVYPWVNLKHKGVHVKPIPAKDGRIDVADIATRIDKQTKVIAVSSVSFVSGARADLRELSQLCRAHGIFLMVDAAQSLGIVPTNVDELGVDALACSAQKGLLSVYGQGLLYCRKEWARTMHPPFLSRSNVAGAAHESDLGDLDHVELCDGAIRFETGNPNFIGIFALDRALDLLEEASTQRIFAHVSYLGSRLIAELKGSGHRVVTPESPDHRASIVVFEHADPDGLVRDLKAHRIVVSARRGRVRVSLHMMNDDADLDRLMARIGSGRH
jgi:selenocysteine lyase/cysteine desulfurase